jgi:uncharacterized protein (TIGR03546 family)
MLKIIKKIFNLLNSQADPTQIVIGVILAMFIALLSPSFFNVLIIFLLALLLNCNFGIFFICAGIFKILTIVIDPVGDILGRWILTLDFLLPLWKTVSEIPVLTLTDFNNTIIMGDFIIGIILTPVIWILTMKIIEYYRKNIRDKIIKFKIIQILTGVDILEGMKK